MSAAGRRASTGAGAQRVPAPEHAHHPAEARAAAARAQREAGTVGWIDGVPVPRAELDARLAALRAGERAGVLPAPDSREGRQLVRWTAHVLLTEHLCAAEAARRGLAASPAPGADVPGPNALGPDGTGLGVPEFDALSEVQLGSITAAAWRSHPAVRALFAATAAAAPRREATPAGPRHRLSIAGGPTPEAARTAPFASIGWSTLDDLPVELAAAARSATAGTTVGPLRSRGGWHLLRVDEIARADDANSAGPRGAAGGAAPPQPPSGAQLRAFARLLDQLRARHVRVAPGFEHPGDPSQPDNSHRH
jgi:[acyl-carrier-protein] S-malonyltransferase